ncbi:MAG: hypothetical protein VX935_12245 [Pseudomonadota bacterium]|jgi:hypothetical protein|nr:hypothetical protein [Pseudomonadota bacterium]
MSQAQSESTGDKFAGIFLKGFWLLVAVGILYSCIDKKTRWLKPDYSQPHEYLSITGYGPSGEGMEGNDHSYSGVGLREHKDNFFPIGKGKCSEYLENITPDRVRLSMRAFNAFLNDEGDYNDTRVAHAKLQCVEYLGRDKSCEDRFMDLAKETKDPQASMLIMLESMTRCDRKKNIGKHRIISLDK